MQVQMKFSRISMLLIAACLSACATQTERGSSGAGAQGRTVAPSAQPRTAAPTQPSEQPQAQAAPAEQVEGTPREEGIIAQSQFHEEEEGAPKEDGITAQSQYHEEEEGAPKEDGITAQSQYHEEEAGAPKEDGITAQSQYHEEEAGAAKKEDILAHNIYGADESGKAPEETVGQPKTFPEETVSQPQTSSEETVSQPQTSPEETVSQPETPPQENVAEPEQPKPVTVLPVTVTVEANPLFDFDNSAVRLDSKNRLDDLIHQLDGVPYGEIVAVGFADPIGAAMYNQTLSERRASSVKAYLMSRGISADKIRIEGRGETQEFAGSQNCGGLRKQRLISCLQPDRRVEVTVSAQKSQ